MSNKVISYYKDINRFFSIPKSCIISSVISFALAFLDFYNKPSELIYTFPFKIVIIFCGIGVCFGLYFVKKYKIYKQFKDSGVNQLDSWLFCGIVLLIEYVVFAAFLSLLQNYKAIVICVLFILFILLSIYRLNKYNKTFSVNDNTTNIDLINLYNFDFPSDVSFPILLDEKDIDYDLLQRTWLIDQLCNSIKSCKSNQSFVIALEGEWGSGKTTILNIAKKRLRENSSYRIIDDFDPWTYGSQEALLVAMYDSILKCAGMKFNGFSDFKVIKDIVSALSKLDTKSNTIVELLFSIGAEKDTLNKVKERIKYQCEKQDLSIVFFIDNIDRTDSDNIIFLLKLIGNIFDLPRIIYVLSYDGTRLSSILQHTLAIDPHYTEKIIQQIIRIPNLNGSTTNEILKKCLYNLFRVYNVTVENHPQELIENYISSHITNIRQFKRLLNSVFSNVFCNNSNLDAYSLLALDCLRFFEPAVYQTIFENRQYFIDLDTLYSRELALVALRSDEYEKRCKKFFSSLGEQISNDTSALISWLFPNSKNYLPTNTETHITENRSVNRYPSINSAKYFDLYFTYSSNDFLSLNIQVKDFIASIKKDKAKSKELLQSTMRAFSWSYQVEWLTQFNLYIDSIPKDCCFELCCAFLETIRLLSDQSSFFQLSPSEQAIALMADIIQNISPQEFNVFLELVHENYKQIRTIKHLLYWLNSINKKTPCENDYIPLLTKEHRSMCLSVIRNKINLFADDYYHFGIIWGLYNDEYGISENEVRNYISSISSKNTIYRILGECVGYSFGRAYRYYISKKNLHILFESEKEVDDLFAKCSPANESETFIRDLFEEYKKREPKFEDERGIYKSDYFQFDL